MVADDPQKKIKLKTFRCAILNSHEKLKREQFGFHDLPTVAEVNQKTVTDNYFRIKQEIVQLIEQEIEILLNTPG